MAEVKEVEMEEIPTYEIEFRSRKAPWWIINAVQRVAFGWMLVQVTWDWSDELGCVVGKFSFQRRAAWVAYEELDITSGRIHTVKFQLYARMSWRTRVRLGWLLLRAWVAARLRNSRLYALKRKRLS